MAKWQVDAGSSLVGFGNIWRMLATVGDYLWKQVRRCECKFCRIHDFLSVDFDILSADLALCYVIWLSV